MEFKKSKFDGHSHYGLNIQRALILTLLLFNVLFLLRGRISVDSSKEFPSNISIHVENIPVTRQAYRQPPPPRPQIPIPSEDEAVPEDDTIVETNLDLSDLNVVYDSNLAGLRTIPPRLLTWQPPDYPDAEKKKGVEGAIKLSMHINEKGKVIDVVVLENETGSEKCARAAIEAAFGSNFLPARDRSRPVSAWVSHQYEFRIKK